MLTRHKRVALAAALGLWAGAMMLWWLSGSSESAPLQTAEVTGNPMATPVNAPPPPRRPTSRTAKAKPPKAVASPPAATAAIRFERAAHEWQGMLPHSNEVWPCPENAEGCGMARACVQGVCAPCLADNECLGTELCVLGVCLVQELVGCLSAADCAPDEVCMMSGFTPLDARNNRALKSKCVRDHWQEDSLEDPAAQHERRLRDEADLAYQNSTTRKGSPAAYSVRPRSEQAIESLRGALR